MNFTFKTIKPTGKYRSFEDDYHQIKLNKKVCGDIGYKKPYKIGLQVIKNDIFEDGNPNCIWKWITLDKKSESLQEAKEFLKNNFKLINDKYKIYTNDD